MNELKTIKGEFMNIFSQSEDESKGFFSDKWNDIIYLIEDKKNEIENFGFLYMVKHIFINIWNKLIGNRIKKLIKIIQWLPILWNDYDWDYSYLLTLIDYKLKRMQKALKEGMAIQEHIDAKVKEIQDVRDIIKQIEEDNFIEKEEKAHEKEFGKLKTKTIQNLNNKNLIEVKFYYAQISKKNNKIAIKKSVGISRLNEIRCQKAYYKMFNLMAKNIQGWWD